MRVKIPPGLSKLRAKHKESVEQNHKDREVKRLRSKSIVSDKIDNISRKQSVICPDSPDHTLLNGDAKHKVSFIYSPANHGPLLTDNFTLSRDRADTMLSVTSDPWKRLSQEVNSYPHETSDHQVDASLNLSQLSPVTQALLRKQDTLLDNVKSLVKIANTKEEEEIIRGEWKLVSSIIDTCFLWLFLLVLAISTVTIFLSAPDWGDDGITSGKT